jgi:uncharacterized Zn finger protein (UPF0148 family)
MRITCPACGVVEVTGNSSICPHCAKTLKVEIEQAKEAERRREQKRRAEAEAERRRAEAEAERRRAEAEAEKVVLKRVMTVIAIAAITITAFVVYIKTRPPAPDVWTSIASGAVMPGVWEGSAGIKISEFGSLTIPQTTIPLMVRIENQHDPENMTFSFKLDFNSLLDTMLSLFAEENMTKDTLWESLSENDVVNQNTAGKYVLAVDGQISVANINQAGQVFINQHKNRIKLQMSFGNTVPGIDSIECILEKIADAKEYKPGEFGEAGVVFYDKGFYSDGWRYLEVSLEPTRETIWSNGATFISNLRTELGEGDFNTHGVIEILGENTAAYVAANYRGGGKNDWYLGNNKEMSVCYENLVQKKSQRKKAKKVSGYVDMKKGFWDSDNTSYWTSEQQSADKAFAIDLQKYLFEKGGGIHASDILPGKTLFNLEYLHDWPARPIRKF